ncbi:hypothetical protein ACQKHW_10670 [Staphylococcus hominis]|uniref:hypothetical protein n=1 Tax=Staphylococcus hominis TaxID=1290 RepID=UPI003CFEA5F9
MTTFVHREPQGDLPRKAVVEGRLALHRVQRRRAGFLPLPMAVYSISSSGFSTNWAGGASSMAFGSVCRVPESSDEAVRDDPALAHQDVLGNG